MGDEAVSAAAVWTGGCQCGAVRYRLKSAPTNPHICHCRMCQKAVGNYFAALARVPLTDIEWTRGTLAIFASSSAVERGFCAACGTPLTYRFLPPGDRINITLGSLDDPNAVPPIRQYGLESQMPFFAHLHESPGSITDNEIAPDVMAKLKSRQHPDHDTQNWPAGEVGQ